MTHTYTADSREIVKGNVFDKYGSKNPVVRLLMGRFFSDVAVILSGVAIESILEVGCGEGETGSRLRELFPGVEYRGIDVSEEIVIEARRRYPTLKYDVLSIYDLTQDLARANVVIALEVLEHLEDPKRGMEAILRLPFRYLLMSVPREPIWRLLNMARWKYLSDWGNTPGHLYHWSKSDFIRFLRQFRPELEIMRVLSPFPWTMVLCKRERGLQE